MARDRQKQLQQQPGGCKSCAGCMHALGSAMQVSHIEMAVSLNCYGRSLKSPGSRSEELAVLLTSVAECWAGVVSTNIGCNAGVTPQKALNSRCVCSLAAGLTRYPFCIFLKQAPLQSCLYE